MIFLLISLSLTSSNNSFYTSEILSLQEELKTLTKARGLLTQSESTDLLTLFPATDSHWSAHRLVPKSHIESDSEAVSVSYISLKPMQGILHPNNLGILIAYSSDLLELREITGTLLYKLDLGYKPLFVSGTNSFDEMRFGVLSESKLETFGVLIEKPVATVTVEDFGVQIPNLYISLYKENEYQLTSRPSSLTLYIKGGKKYWAVGFESGKIELVTLNGVLENEISLGSGKILGFERFGPQLIVVTDQTAGLVNMNSLKLMPSCGSGGNSIALDAVNTTSILHVSDGKTVKTFDFRNIVLEQFVCKEIRNINEECNRVYSTKDFLACLKDGEIKMIESGGDRVLNKIRAIGKHQQEGIFGFKTNSGGYFLTVFGGKEVYSFEVFVKKGSSGSSDISMIRYAIISVGVVAFVYWQYSKVKKPKVSKEKKNN